MKAKQFAMRAQEVYDRYYKRSNPLKRVSFNTFRKICFDLQNANATGQSFASIARYNQVNPSMVEGTAKWLHVESGSPFGRLMSRAKRAGSGKAIPRQSMIEYLKFRHDGRSITAAAKKSGVSTHAARGWEIRNISQEERERLEKIARNLARRHPLTDAIVEMLKVKDQSRMWRGIPRYSAYVVAKALEVDPAIAHKLNLKVRNQSERAAVKNRYNKSTNEERYLILEEAKTRAKRTLHELEQKYYTPYAKLSAFKKIKLQNAVIDFLGGLKIRVFADNGKPEDELRHSLQRAFVKISESGNAYPKENLANEMGLSVVGVDRIINIINGNQKGWKILMHNGNAVWINPELPKLVQD